MSARRIEDSWEYNAVRALEIAATSGGKPAIFGARRAGGRWKYFVLVGKRSQERARELGPWRR